MRKRAQPTEQEAELRRLREENRQLKPEAEILKKASAYTESFFATLKKELVYQNAFATREEARNALFAYINMTYNRYRLHSSLGYQSPDAFEAASTNQPLALAA